MLLLIMVGSLARSIERARWTDGLDVLFPIALLGVLAGVVLAGSKLGTLQAHAAGVFIGGFVIVWQTGKLLPPSELEQGNRFGIMWDRLRQWIDVLLQGGANYDPLLFVLTMGAIVWFLAYNSSWFVLRYGWVWWALLPTGLVMLVNLGYVSRPSTGLFVLFLLAGMLLMIHTALMQRHTRWQEEGLGQEAGVVPRIFMFGAVISLLLMAIAWQGPSRSLALTARSAFRQVEQPWTRVQDRWENAFAFLYPGGSGAARGGIGGGFTSFSDSFELGGPLRLGNRLLFTADGEPRQYWRSVSSDVYTGRAWTINESDRPDGNVMEVQTRQLDSRARQTNFPESVRKLKQTVTVVVPMRNSVFGAEAPFAFDRDVAWQLSPVRRTLSIPVEGSALPQDVNQRVVARSLSSARRLIAEIGTARVARASADRVVLRQIPTPPADDAAAASATAAPTATATTQQEDNVTQSILELQGELEQLRAQGVEATYQYRRGRQAVLRYAFSEPNQEDVLSVVSSVPLGKGAKYSVTSIVANPTDQELNNVKDPLPAWVSDRYLKLPDTVTPRTRALARRITRDARTQHEKARAIEDYLRQMKYREDMPFTPPDRDFVDYFLFDLREGYCTYYASAMAVLLRSVDVPARVTRGFAPGKYDADREQYLITESQAHAWPQVYYPKYGWVNYEPTPIRDLVSRTAAVGGGLGRGETDQNYNPAGDAYRRKLQESLEGNGGTGAGVSGGIPLPVRIGVTSVLALLVLALLAYTISRIRLRGLRGARRQYAKLLQVGTMLGVRPVASQTPNEYGSRLGTTLPRASSPVRTITSRYVGEVFGKQQHNTADMDGEWKRVASEAARTMPQRFAQLMRSIQDSRLVQRIRRR